MKKSFQCLKIYTGIIAIALLTGSQGFAAAWTCHDLFSPIFTLSPADTLQSRYGLDEKQLPRTSRYKIPVLFNQTDEKTLRPKISANTQIHPEEKTYDATIIGSGPAGLAAALQIVQHGKSVLILERNSQPGGLATGSNHNGVVSANGAAYSVGPDGLIEWTLFKDAGRAQYAKKYSIAEFIDLYALNGKLHPGVWPKKALKDLPASFEMYMQSIIKLDAEGAGGDAQRGDSPKAFWADSMYAADMIRKMPELMAKWTDSDSKRILKRFNEDTSLPKNDPMKDVIDFMDDYCRSALGRPAAYVSARQLIDFYISELTTRYAGPTGTGFLAEGFVKALSRYPGLVTIKTLSPVAHTENTSDGNTRTIFFEGGVAKSVISKKVLFATSVKLANDLIPELQDRDPEKYARIDSIKMTDYAVLNLHLKGHPYREAYDTWLRLTKDQWPKWWKKAILKIWSWMDPTYVAANLNYFVPTDFILTPWNDPKVNGYKGMRQFQKDPEDDRGGFTIYFPLGESNASNFRQENNLAMTDLAIDYVTQNIRDTLQATGQKLQIDFVEFNRWPESIHTVVPNWLRDYLPVLQRPVGNIYFASNTIRAPELESAAARGAAIGLQMFDLPSPVPKEKTDPRGDPLPNRLPSIH